MPSARTLSLLLVGCASFGVYANTCLNGFAMDDRYAVVESERLKSASPKAFFTSAWGAEARRAQDRRVGAAYYRPLTELSLWLDYRLFGLWAAGYHLTNALLHAAVSALVYLLLWLLWRQRDPSSAEKAGEQAAGTTPQASALVPLFGGLLFAVHSVHTEVVNLISYRAELIAALAFIAALVLQLRWPGPQRWVAVLLPLLYAAGLLAKESAVTLPAWVALAAFLTGPPQHRRGLVWRVSALAAGLLCYLFLRNAVLGGGPPAADFFAGLPAALRVLSVLKIFAHYLQLLLLPWPLAPFYDWTILPPADSLGDGLAWLGAAELVGLILGAWLLRSRHPRLSFGIAAFLLGLLPVAHLLPLCVGAGERFLYIPSIGATVAACWAFERLHGRAPRATLAAACGLLLTLGGWSVVRNTHWRDDLRLQGRVVYDYPHGFSGHYNLGKLLLEAGKPHAAIASFRKADRCFPELSSTASWWAAAHLAAGEHHRAIEVLDRAIARHGQLPALSALRARIRAQMLKPASVAPTR